MELERLLRTQGFGSRRDCRELIRRGRVAVAGVVCDDPYADFAPDGLVFSVDGAPWRYRAAAYLMLNKPANYECSHAPRFHPSVYTLLPRPLVDRGVQAVGRLDEDTTGLLLLSDDGQFIHRCTSPKKDLTKVYDVTLKHPVDAAQVAALLEGVVLNDSPQPVAARAAEIRAERLLRLTVTEGRYHLVKRMLAAAGNRVVGLDRVAIGGLRLAPDLAPGQWSWLDDDALAALSGAVAAP